MKMGRSQRTRENDEVRYGVVNGGSGWKEWNWLWQGGA